MKKIEIKQLVLTNFKGIKSLSLDFDQNTSILGDNGTGKTSIFDAFTWLLFGKDSTDRKDFEIKTLDKFNVVIPKIEHEVSAIILVDGEEITIKRILKEKWVKQRGALEAEFTGNETLYYYNEVPLSMKEFQNKISQILDEQVFKLITSPTAFNSLKWQDRRNVLVQIVGEVTDAELAKGNSDYENLVSQLSNKSLDEYKKQIASTIKKTKDDIKTIPTRIDEVTKGKPERVDEFEIEQAIEAKKNQIENIDDQLQDKSAAHDEVIKKRNANQSEIHQLQSQINTIEFEGREKAKNDQRSETSKADPIKNELAELRSELESAEAKKNTLVSKEQTLRSGISALESQISTGRDLWNEVNSKELDFNETEFCCPTCKREFDAADVDQKKADLNTNFNIDKQDRLKRISTAGKANSEEKINLETELATLQNRLKLADDFILKTSQKITGLKANLLLINDEEKQIARPTIESILQTYLSENENYQTLKAKITELEALKFEIPESNNAEAKAEKVQLSAEIDALRSRLSANTQIENADKRIKELEDEESNLAQQIANIEKTQFIIDNFIKLKIDTIEGKINKKFSFVKFKLFETQINGAEVETCEALINGVPFSDANTASKINAGVDIINTLCEYYQVSALIFLDNRESVVDLIPTENQVINLIVSAADKKLRIA